MGNRFDFDNFIREMARAILDSTDLSNVPQITANVNTDAQRRITVNDPGSGRTWRIVDSSIGDLLSITIKRFDHAENVINDVRKLAQQLSSPDKRENQLDTLRESPIIYEIGDFLYYMNPENFYVKPIGFFCDGESDPNAVQEIDKIVTNLFHSEDRHAYHRMQPDLSTKINNIPEIFSKLYGLDYDEAEESVNDALRDIIGTLEYDLRRPPTGKKFNDKITEMVQLGTATLAVGVSEPVRNYKTLVINMMLAEIKPETFVFSDHSMAQGGTWGKHTNDPQEYTRSDTPDTGFDGRDLDKVSKIEKKVAKLWKNTDRDNSRLLRRRMNDEARDKLDAIVKSSKASGGASGSRQGLRASSR